MYDEKTMPSQLAKSHKKLGKQNRQSYDKIFTNQEFVKVHKKLDEAMDRLYGKTI